MNELRNNQHSTASRRQLLAHARDEHSHRRFAPDLPSLEKAQPSIAGPLLLKSAHSASQHRLDRVSRTALEEAVRCVQGIERCTAPPLPH